jgi:hypothetical protein
MPSIIVSIKLAAIGIAIAVISLLIYGYHLQDWVAIALGIVAYFFAKAALAVGIGYVWGRRDAREMKQYLADLPLQIRQDIIDNAPSDVKPHLADLVKKTPPK